MDFIGALSPVNIQFMLQGFLLTIEVAILSIAISFVISILVGTVRYAKVPVLGKVFAVLVETIRNLPLLLIIFFLPTSLCRRSASSWISLQRPSSLW